ncbi:MAG: methyl-accepting chemotaxis protein, partial [Desulfococcaceae bacterium]|nr:methyl-accepting chemotaxis protein [Desulfococcaceae bacterium]
MIKNISSFFQNNITRQLLLINSLLCIAFLLITAMVIFSFQHIKETLIAVFSKETARIIENSAVSRNLARNLSDMNLIRSTFYGNEEILEKGGDSLLEHTEALLSKSEDQNLRFPLRNFRQKTEKWLQQCKAVNLSRRDIEESEKNMEDALRHLDETIARVMIEMMMNGEDTVGIEQLGILVSGYRESLSMLRIEFMKAGLTHFEQSRQEEEHPILLLADDLHLRFRTLTASRSEIAGIGETLLRMIEQYKEKIRTFHETAAELRIRMNHLQEEKEKLLSVMEKTDKSLGSRTSESLQLLISRINGTVGFNFFIFILILPVAALGFFTAYSIKDPIRQLIYYIQRLSCGDIPEKITQNYKGEFNRLRDNLNDLIQGAEDTTCIAEEIARGNLRADVMIRSENDRLMKAMQEMIRQLNEISENMNGLTRNIRDGRLDCRGDADVFSGCWQELICGVNALIEAFVSPFSMTASYIEKISSGSIPEKITREFKGDFNEIKNNLNRCINVVNGLTAETLRLTENAAAGNLTVRGNAEKFGGDYRRILAGINRSLDTVIGPLNTSIEYMERISIGDFPELIQEEYPGHFNKIKENLNMLIANHRRSVQIAEKVADGDLSAEVKIFSDKDMLGKSLKKMVENVKNIADEIHCLTDAVRKGKPDARGDETKFRGEYARIIREVNGTLDAMVNPLNMAADYIRHISEGDIPEIICQEYQGDFDEIRKNINTMITNLISFSLDVQKAARNVAEGSRQMNSSAEQICAGIAHQAAGIEEISVSMEEMSRQVNQNARNSGETAAIAAKTVTGAGEGSQVVNETVTAMKKISEKIRIIEDIARQTNMLALNAAIEAARAGEHGRGFGVVAAEVRKLAEKSRKSAKSINALSFSSLEISENAGKILEETVSGIRKTAELIQEISASGAEQAEGIGQVNRAVQQLDQII